MDLKNSLALALGVFCIVIISFILYSRGTQSVSSYIGLGNSINNAEQVEVKKDIIVNSEILNSDKIEFVQRKVKGGGANPGWVISLLETQPNIFTGRVIVDDGVYQHPVTLKEEVTDIFVGEMKGVNGKDEIFSMKKINQKCTDEENTTYEYSLTGSYGATSFAGCGGDALTSSN